jgi:hypothetical protein
VYVRWPVERLNVSRSFRTVRGWVNEFDYPATRARYPLAQLAAHLVEVARTAPLASPPLRCLYVNMDVRPPSDAAEALRIFERAAAVPYPGAIHSTPPMRIRLSSLTQTSERAKLISVAWGGHGPTGWTQRTAFTAADLIDGISERRDAVAACLLITEAGTHWTDWVIAKRLAAHQPTAVVTWLDHGWMNATWHGPAVDHEQVLLPLARRSDDQPHERPWALGTQTGARWMRAWVASATPTSAHRSWKRICAQRACTDAAGRVRRSKDIE